MYTQVEMKMLSANYIWLIRDPAHAEPTEGMETEMLRGRAAPGGPLQANRSWRSRMSFLSWMLK